ncbi:GINS complex, Sld5 component [Aulographum hederae CBS 113979]|uniref:DNA replication complex GINS protein SLD5 n=1 Tax=Aulographum hederae CBS 113979 TaxID=1176131 RepID=A0A6G1GUJ3_9PEZI|nr:GINS complex, Sld5 component [Aulographum hederae CBS 113979]
MNLDEILAEATGPSIPQSTLDLQELSRVWVAERVAPELLPWPETLMERVLAGIRRQVEIVEEQTGDMDSKTNFKLIVIQTELERWKFLVRSLLRARIAKIDAHPHHILFTISPTLASQSSSTSYNPDLLSPAESNYLHTHTALLSSHYSSSFLSTFPSALQSLDDTSGGISMISAPDLDTAVFVRCLEDCTVERTEGGESLILRRGDVWVVRWRGVKLKVERGLCELI